MGKIPTLASLNFITGQLGSGKSVYATRLGFHYLAMGKLFACNYDLTPYSHPYQPDHPSTGLPWYQTVFEKMKHPKGLASEPRYRFHTFRDIAARAFRFEEQDDLFDFTVPGNPKHEDRGLLVIDEGALRMNSRDWQQRGQKNKKSGRHHLEDLRFMVNLRKMGWTALIITQGYGMVDAQYRDLGPTEIHMRNFAKWRMPLLNIAASPVPAFVAIHYQRENRMVTGRDWFLLDKTAGHFESLQQFTFDEDRVHGMRLQYDFPDVIGRMHPTPEEWAARREGSDRVSGTAPARTARPLTAGGVR